jgi:hypothetical protein
MRKFRLAKGPGGATLQSAMPKHVPAQSMRPGGRILKGVVIATYEFDNTAGPFTTVATPHPRAIYCDVLCYGQWKGLVPRAMVRQLRSGLHDGDIWKPRAAGMDITGNSLNVNIGTNPADMDGDHVTVEFLEDDFSQPIITGSIPHPAADKGNAARDIGNRLKLVGADGDPRLIKHHGAFFGIDDDGNFVVDLTRAYNGVTNDRGLEPHLSTEPAFSGDDGTDLVLSELGAEGNTILRLRKGSTLTLQIEDGANLELADKDGNAMLTLGDGAVHVAIVEKLEALYNQLKAQLDAFDIAHAGQFCGVGPVSPPAPIVAPPWDAAINSSKVAIPDG